MEGQDTTDLASSPPPNCPNCSSVQENIQKREREVSEKEKEVSEKEREVSERDRVLSEREKKVSERETLLGEREKEISEKETELKERFAEFDRERERSRTEDEDARIKESGEGEEEDERGERKIEGDVKDLLERLTALEKENSILKEQCQASEALRTNIRKVSANWFERKCRHSESEGEEGGGRRRRRLEEEEEEEEGDLRLNGEEGGQGEGEEDGCVRSKEDNDKRMRREEMDSVRRKRRTQLLPEDEEEGRKFMEEEGVRRMREEEDEDTTKREMILQERLKDVPRLLAEVSFQAYKLDVTEHMCIELRRRVRHYESVIDEREAVILSLKEQLGTYFADNQKMTQQIRNMARVFEELEVSETVLNRRKKEEKEGNKEEEGEKAEGEGAASKEEDKDTRRTYDTYLPSLPDPQEFKSMSSSVSKTILKLKELIMEKKSLVTEIERLKVLNVELTKRVEQQESRLENVSDSLRKTWLVVSDLKEQHASLHDFESALRYELKEKRELLHNLRSELELSREQWQKIRQMNLASEEEWNNIRTELNKRKDEQKNKKEEEEQAIALPEVTSPDPANFEPPVDLLLDMAIEYGVVDAGDETTTNLVAAIEGEDMSRNRLQELEDQCSLLYHKLMASSARSLTLASRLTQLHHRFGQSSDEEDDDDDDEEEEEYEEEQDAEEEEEEEESQSPEPESYDTAYSSDTPHRSPEDTRTETRIPEEEEEEEEPAPDQLEDDLSKRLINFLPRKIEILRFDNQKLEERCQVMLEERAKSEAELRDKLEEERQLRRQLEDKLDHLGKCIDELKLERNGQIQEAEQKLKQKMESLSKKEQQFSNLSADLESLREKFDQRGMLLNAANDRVKEVEALLSTSEAALADTQQRLALADAQGAQVAEAHKVLDCQYHQLTEELEGIRHQLKAEKDRQEEEKKLREEEDEQKKREEEKRRKDEEEEKKRREEEERSKEENREEARKKREEEWSEERRNYEQKLNETNAEISQLRSYREESQQLNADNDNLREKVVQLLSRRVRVCDDCFSVQAELATLIATQATGVVTELPDDETFSLVSEDDLKSSGSEASLDVSPTDTVASGELLTQEMIRANPPTDVQAWVGANSRLLVPVSLHKGATLHWTLQCHPKNISFSVLHQPPNDEDPERRVLIPTTKLAGSDGSVVKGRLLAKQPGVYTLVIDNSSSRYTAKKVTYSLYLGEIQSPSTSLPMP